MKKDVIYIDIEDDITSIIDKVASAGANIVALVPPKRIGVLQSVVNLKLLQRGAESHGKRIVIITNNEALSGLAGSVKIPVAKNLQSKPEIAAIPALEVDDDDVIDGEQLPVGDFAAKDPAASASDDSSKDTTTAAAIGAVSADAASDITPKADKKKTAKPGVKIPNFGSFRKKMILGIAAFILLIGFGVWAIVFAPKATIAIRANTEPVSISKPIRVDPATETAVDSARFKGVTQQIKKSNSIDFDATGEKEVGERATGTINLSNNRFNAVTIDAGTQFSADGQVFTNNEDITVPGPTLCNSGGSAAVCPGTASGGITATEIGDEYNLPAQSFSVDADVSASTSEATSGGSSKIVSVVSQADVDKAREQLAAQDEDEIKTQLIGQFDDTVIVIPDSFEAATADPSVNPAVGRETERARISAETTYTVMGIQRSDVEQMIREIVNEEIDEPESQRIYDLGLEDIELSRVEKLDGAAYGLNIRVTAQIGPNIEPDQLAENAVGKKSGQITEDIRSVEGIEDVTVDLSPFWVRTAPAADKITVEFIVNDE